MTERKNILSWKMPEKTKLPAPIAFHTLTNWYGIGIIEMTDDWVKYAYYSDDEHNYNVEGTEEGKIHEAEIEWLLDEDDEESTEFKPAFKDDVGNIYFLDEFMRTDYGSHFGSKLKLDWANLPKEEYSYEEFLKALGPNQIWKSTPGKTSTAAYLHTGAVLPLKIMMIFGIPNISNVKWSHSADPESISWDTMPQAVGLPNEEPYHLISGTPKTSNLKLDWQNISDDGTEEENSFYVDEVDSPEKAQIWFRQQAKNKSSWSDIDINWNCLQNRFVMQYLEDNVFFDDASGQLCILVDGIKHAISGVGADKLLRERFLDNFKQFYETVKDTQLSVQGEVRGDDFRLSLWDFAEQWPIHRIFLKALFFLGEEVYNDSGIAHVKEQLDKILNDFILSLTYESEYEKYQLADDVPYRLYDFRPYFKIDNGQSLLNIMQYLHTLIPPGPTENDRDKREKLERVKNIYDKVYRLFTESRYSSLKLNWANVPEEYSYEEFLKALGPNQIWKSSPDPFSETQSYLHTGNSVRVEDGEVYNALWFATKQEYPFNLFGSIARLPNEEPYILISGTPKTSNLKLDWANLPAPVPILTFEEQKEHAGERIAFIEKAAGGNWRTWSAEIRHDGGISNVESLNFTTTDYNAAREYVEEFVRLWNSKYGIKEEFRPVQNKPCWYTLSYDETNYLENLNKSDTYLWSTPELKIGDEVFDNETGELLGTIKSFEGSNKDQVIISIPAEFKYLLEENPSGLITKYVRDIESNDTWNWKYPDLNLESSLKLDWANIKEEYSYEELLKALGPNQIWKCMNFWAPPGHRFKPREYLHTANDFYFEDVKDTETSVSNAIWGESAETPIEGFIKDVTIRKREEPFILISGNPRNAALQLDWANVPEGYSYEEFLNVVGPNQIWEVTSRGPGVDPNFKYFHTGPNTSLGGDYIAGPLKGKIVTDSIYSTSINHPAGFVDECAVDIREGPFKLISGTPKTSSVQPGDKVRINSDVYQMDFQNTLGYDSRNLKGRTFEVEALSPENNTIKLKSGDVVLNEKLENEDKTFSKVAWLLNPDVKVLLDRFDLINYLRDSFGKSGHVSTVQKDAFVTGKYNFLLQQYSLDRDGYLVYERDITNLSFRSFNEAESYAMAMAEKFQIPFYKSINYQEAKNISDAQIGLDWAMPEVPETGDKVILKKGIEDKLTEIGISSFEIEGVPGIVSGIDEYKQDWVDVRFYVKNDVYEYILYMFPLSEFYEFFDKVEDESSLKLDWQIAPKDIYEEFPASATTEYIITDEGAKKYNVPNGSVIVAPGKSFVPKTGFIEVHIEFLNIKEDNSQHSERVENDDRKYLHIPLNDFYEYFIPLNKSLKLDWSVPVGVDPNNYIGWLVKADTVRRSAGTTRYYGVIVAIRGNDVYAIWERTSSYAENRYIWAAPSLLSIHGNNSDLTTLDLDRTTFEPIKELKSVRQEQRRRFPRLDWAAMSPEKIKHVDAKGDVKYVDVGHPNERLDVYVVSLLQAVQHPYDKGVSHYNILERIKENLNSYEEASEIADNYAFENNLQRLIWPWEEKLINNSSLKLDWANIPDEHEFKVGDDVAFIHTGNDGKKYTAIGKIDWIPNKRFNVETRPYIRGAYFMEEDGTTHMMGLFVPFNELHFIPPPEPVESSLKLDWAPHPDYSYVTVYHDKISGQDYFESSNYFEIIDHLISIEKAGNLSDVAYITRSNNIFSEDFIYQGDGRGTWNFKYLTPDERVVTKEKLKGSIIDPADAIVKRENDSGYNLNWDTTLPDETAGKNTFQKASEILTNRRFVVDYVGTSSDRMSEYHINKLFDPPLSYEDIDQLKTDLMSVIQDIKRVLKDVDGIEFPNPDMMYITLADGESEFGSAYLGPTELTDRELRLDGVVYPYTVFEIEYIISVPFASTNSLKLDWAEIPSDECNTLEELKNAIGPNQIWKTRKFERHQCEYFKTGNEIGRWEVLAPDIVKVTGGHWVDDPSEELLNNPTAYVYEDRFPFKLLDNVKLDWQTPEPSTLHPNQEWRDFEEISKEEALKLIDKATDGYEHDHLYRNKALLNRDDIKYYLVKRYIKDTPMWYWDVVGQNIKTGKSDYIYMAVKDGTDLPHPRNADLQVDWNFIKVEDMFRFKKEINFRDLVDHGMGYMVSRLNSHIPAGVQLYPDVYEVIRIDNYEDPVTVCLKKLNVIYSSFIELKYDDLLYLMEPYTGDTQIKLDWNMDLNGYQGIYTAPGKYEVRKNGEILDIKPSLKLSNHSPSGFAWGYAGSGPAQLALAILLDYTDDDNLALAAHQKFKFDVIANLSPKWSLSDQEIQKWIIDNGYEFGVPDDKPELFWQVPVSKYELSIRKKEYGFGERPAYTTSADDRRYDLTLEEVIDIINLAPKNTSDENYYSVVDVIRRNRGDLNYPDAMIYASYLDITFSFDTGYWYDLTEDEERMVKSLITVPQRKNIAKP